ncbi:hypothetical protein BLNAU_7370 [Blattamonas nauphoetae]|uniref:Uncharacterized protein n=1 Tax=Blattamonas nauphoetae TaxID=2049346 RepID=A0ABQ9Y1V9_9EUKA|nr:hypothetical protein BLNAU_7370 [Blattamonas nauphoetae]
MTLLTPISSLVVWSRLPGTEPVWAVVPETALRYSQSKIARNVLPALPSSVGPLSQTKFLTFDGRPYEIMPLDQSEILMKTLDTRKEKENLERNLKDILFRSSWISLLSHILFDAHMFARYCTYQTQFPAIALALNRVCTRKGTNPHFHVEIPHTRRGLIDMS